MKSSLFAQYLFLKFVRTYVRTQIGDSDIYTDSSYWYRNKVYSELKFKGMTTNDDEDLKTDLDSLLTLQFEGRILAAKPIIDRLIKRDLTEKTNVLIEGIARRIAEVESIIAESSDELDAGWLEAMTLFGITTSYIPLPSGLLRIKLEGKLDTLPLLPQVAVLREVDLLNQWLPLCSKSRLLHVKSHNEVLGYMCLSAPFMSRDAVFHAYGVDCLEEHDGLVLLVVKSIDDSHLQALGLEDDIELPPLERGLLGLHDRLDIK